MLQVWRHICATDVLPRAVDQDTVRSLELLCPVASLEDSEYVSSLVHDKTIFPTVLDSVVRQNIFRRVTQCSRILSMLSFRGDVMYLAAGQRALKPLFCHNPSADRPIISVPHFKAGRIKRRTVRRHASFKDLLKWHFTYDSRYFDANYLDLWMHALRHYHQLSTAVGNRPPVDGSDAEDQLAHVDVQQQAELALRAKSLGFRSSELERVLAAASDAVRLDQAGTARPVLSTNRPLQQAIRRCNRPSRKVLEANRPHLFPAPLYGHGTADKKQYATCLFVLYDIMKCFFGSHPAEHLLSSARCRNDEEALSESVDAEHYSSDPVTSVDCVDTTDGSTGADALNALAEHAVHSSTGLVTTVSPRERDSLRLNNHSLGGIIQELQHEQSRLWTQLGQQHEAAHDDDRTPSSGESLTRPFDPKRITRIPRSRHDHAVNITDDSMDQDFDELTNGRANRDQEELERVRVEGGEVLQRTFQEYGCGQTTPRTAVSRLRKRLRKKRFNRVQSVIDGRVSKQYRLQHEQQKTKRLSHAEVAAVLRKRGKLQIK